MVSFVCIVLLTLYNFNALLRPLQKCMIIACLGMVLLEILNSMMQICDSM